MSATGATGVTPDLSLNINPTAAGGSETPEPGTMQLGLNMAAKRVAQRGLRMEKRLHQPRQTTHGYSGGKRSSRALRMRWTTALHTHFVHAVELLGGHESMLKALTNQHCP
jgi:hypothetical protein